MHATQTRRDGDQLADTRDKTTDERGDIAFLAEVLFCALELLAGEKAHVSEFAISELIDDESAKPNREGIVDDGAYHGS